MNDLKEKLESRLESYFKNKSIIEPLSSAMEYSLLGGGKRLRPMMCLESCKAFGGNTEYAMPIACALEMIHTYSLIHDDLPCMDDDDMRRGKPSNHIKFGENGAVLAGDALLSYAFEIMLESGKKIAADIPRFYDAAYEVIKGAGVFGMVAGQAADLKNEDNPEAGEDELKFIHKNKTGAMIKASLLSGAIIGGASEEELDLMAEFGDNYGMLFQITDDILDVEGDYKKLGKSTGKDASSNKLTYPKIYGLEQSKKLAEEIAAKALYVLKKLGKDTEYFVDLVNNTLNRES